MLFIKAKPSEYLVVARRGRLTSRGVAGRAFRWPGSSFTRVPSTKQEARFEMTQETKDGVPLRFKGIVIYRVTAPEVTARLFDFSRQPSGQGEISALLGHICLGELRALVAHMTMSECIEQRKTTLTSHIAAALHEIVEAHDTEGAVDPGWGVELDVVQVAQVFIIDDELRRQLEAEVRGAIRAASELATIESQKGVGLAQIGLERDLEREGLETERRRSEIRRERLHLDHEVARQQAEADAALQQLKLDAAGQTLERERAMRTLENEVLELRVRGEMLGKRAELELRKAILPLEQLPSIAAALGGMFRGARLSFLGGGEAQVLAGVAPLVELLADALRDARRPS
jgi:hypothetical protein